jgi:hypothetical protein
MPFLAAEGVLIDPTRDRVVLHQLQPADDCKLKERKEVEKAGKSDVSAADDDSCKMEDVNVVPSICPKVRTRGIPTPPLDLIWIKAFEDFNKSWPTSTNILQYLAKFNGVPPLTPSSETSILPSWTIT